MRTSARCITVLKRRQWPLPDHYEIAGVPTNRYEPTENLQEKSQRAGSSRPQVVQPILTRGHNALESVTRITARGRTVESARQVQGTFDD